MTTNISKKNNAYKIRDEINPKGAWRNILLICLFALVAGLAYDYYLYTFVSREPLYVEVRDGEATAERLKVEKINSIITFFDGKIERNMSLKNKNLIDPGL